MRPADREEQPDLPTEGESRRDFLSLASFLSMAGGLVAGYGAFLVVGVRFLFPTGERTKGWQFVATVDELQPGEAMGYIAPSGAKVVVARQGSGDTAADFLALSSVCPHLGCQVHWEPQRERFFCPCHNGEFDREGKPLAGPPRSANQQLLRFPLRVENRLLFIEAPLESVTQAGNQLTPDRSVAARASGTTRHQEREETA